MDFYDISWLKYAMINVLSIGIYIIAFLISYTALAKNVESNRLFIASVLAFFGSISIASLFITSQFVSATEYADLILPVSTALCLAFWSGIAVVASWVYCNFELRNKNVSHSQDVKCANH
jgi:hypothetical protein